jgi:hypothetical protein
MRPPCPSLGPFGVSGWKPKQPAAARRAALRPIRSASVTPYTLPDNFWCSVHGFDLDGNILVVSGAPGAGVDGYRRFDRESLVGSRPVNPRACQGCLPGRAQGA